MEKGALELTHTAYFSHPSGTTQCIFLLISLTLRPAKASPRLPFFLRCAAKKAAAKRVQMSRAMLFNELPWRSLPNLTQALARARAHIYACSHETDCVYKVSSLGVFSGRFAFFTG